MNKPNFKGIVHGDDIINALQELEDTINDLVMQSNTLDSATLHPTSPTNKDTAPLTVQRAIQTLLPFKGENSTTTPLNIRLFTTQPHEDPNELISFIPSWTCITTDSDGMPSAITVEDGVFINGYGNYLTYSSTDGWGFTDEPSLDAGTVSYKVQMIELENGKYILKLINDHTVLLGQHRIERGNPTNAPEAGKMYGIGFRAVNEPIGGVSNKVLFNSNVIQGADVYETGNNLIMYPSLIPLGFKTDSEFSIEFTESELGIPSPIKKIYWELVENDL